MSAYDDMMKSLKERVDSGAQARDEAEDEKKKREKQQKDMEEEMKKRQKERENATGNRVIRGLRQWINGDKEEGGASKELIRHKGRGGVRG